MGTESFIITKRDGRSESFSLEKIKHAIVKACEAVGDSLNGEELQKIVGHLRFCNGMSVEDIQNQVEVAMMSEQRFKAAKAFIVYRNRRTEDRTTAERVRYLAERLGAYVKGKARNVKQKDQLAETAMVEIAPKETGRSFTRLFSGIGGLEMGLDKIFTENTKSENKQILQQAFETISEEASLEEVINELNEYTEEHKIDKRIFNGRNAEECFSECVNNSEVWAVLEEVSRKWQGRGIEPSRASQLLLEALTVTFYQLRGNVDGWGKATFVLRFAEEQLGKSLGIGVRAFQKGVQRIMNFFHRGAGNPIREAWKEKREDTIEVLRSLVNMIKSALLDKMPALALAN